MTPRSKDLLQEPLLGPLTRIAEALERLAPPEAPAFGLESADAFTWTATSSSLEPVPHVNRVPMELLQGIDRVRDILVANTQQFASGKPANNALLWGARGMGKSSLVKAVHAEINASAPGILALIEIHREDIASLPRLMRLLRDQVGTSARRFLIFCDDLSFDSDDASYKSLRPCWMAVLRADPRTFVSTRPRTDAI